MDERTEDRLSCLFYVILRDHLPAGTLEKIMKEYIVVLNEWNTPVFSHSHLGYLSRDFAKALIKGESWISENKT